MKAPGKIEAVCAGAVNGKRLLHRDARLLEARRIDRASSSELQECREPPGCARDTRTVAKASHLLPCAPQKLEGSGKIGPRDPVDEREVVLGVRLLGIAPVNVGTRVFGEGDIRARVSHPDRTLFPAIGEAFERELADRNQHPEARLARDLRLADEAVLDKAAQRVEDVAPELLRRAADLLDLGQHPTPHKDGESREELALRWIQQVPAPGDRASQRALPFG